MMPATRTLPVLLLAPLLALLEPAPADLLLSHPVTRQVGSPSFDRPECVEPVEDERRGQLNLFG